MDDEWDDERTTEAFRQLVETGRRARREREKRMLGVVVGSTALVYAVLWVGGYLSFRYTHNCVRSHIETVPDSEGGPDRDIRVCDFYSANAKRWTFLDPIRAIARH